MAETFGGQRETPLLRGRRTIAAARGKLRRFEYVVIAFGIYIVVADATDTTSSGVDNTTDAAQRSLI
jgi:hypothetical protein